MEDSPPTEGGMSSTITRILKTLCSVVENRLQLFLVEWKEERVRLFGAVILGVAGIIFALMTLVMITLTVLVVFWETHRALVLGVVTAAYAGAAAAAFFALRARLQRWQAFSATLEQFKKDRSCLEKPN